MLTNLFILVLSFFGLGGQSNTKPMPNDKPGTEIPRPSKYDNEKGGHQRPGGGWDLN